MNHFTVALLATCISAIQLTSFEQEPLFAQLFVEESDKTCTSTFDLRKSSADLDFNKLVTSSDQFKDASFTPTTNSLYWAGVDQKDADLISETSSVTWARANSIAGAKMWGTSGRLTNEDANQGSIGNCFFIAAAAAIAEKPERIQKVFLNQSNDLNDAGIYGVNFYTMGVKHTVVVDDYLPVLKGEDGDLSTVFSRIGNDKAMWMPILEKAFSKLNGNYQHIIAGSSTQATDKIVGGSGIENDHSEITTDEQKLKLWNQMMQYNNEDDMIFGGTQGESDKDTNAEGLTNGHAFVVQHVQETKDGLKMVRVRNPWGSESYKGKYSDAPSAAGDWTSELRSELNWPESETDLKDGVFWVDFDYYVKNFSETALSKDTNGWHNSAYLKLNDNSRSGTNGSKYAGKTDWCGNSCTRHVISLKSSVDQDVYLTAYTQDKRMYAQNDECFKDFKMEHLIKLPHDDWNAWKFGSTGIKPFKMTAGQEIEVILEMNFGESDIIKKDWSITTWSELGAIEITNKDGSATDTFSVIALSGDKSGSSSDDKKSDDADTDKDEEKKKSDDAETDKDEEKKKSEEAKADADGDADGDGDVDNDIEQEAYADISDYNEADYGDEDY